MEEVLNNAPTDILMKTMENLPFSDDPVVQTIKWLGLIAIVVAFAARPIMLYVRSFKQDKVDNAANAAHADLFDKLSETIKNQRNMIADYDAKIADYDAKIAGYDAKIADLYKKIEYMHHNDTELKMENERLRMRLEKMELLSSENATLRERLNQKGEKIRLLILEINALKERIKYLENRLTADELLVEKEVSDINENIAKHHSEDNEPATKTKTETASKKSSSKTKK